MIMRMVLILWKNELLRISKVNQIRYADTKIRRKTFILYLIICVIAFGLLVPFTREMSSIFLLSLSENEIINSLIVPMVAVCLILNLLISVFWGSGLLLSNTNADVQLALPIRLPILISSKLLVLNIILAFLDMILLLPMIVLFGTTAGTGILFYLIMAGNIILLQTIPCLLGTIIGTGIYHILRSPSALFSRLKTILIVLFLFVFMGFMFWKFPELSKGGIHFNFATTALYRLINRCARALLQRNVLSLVAYWTTIMISDVILLRGLIAIYRNWYCNSISNKETSSPVSSKAFVPNSAISTLIKRERRRYFSIPVYMTNTACGFLFAAVYVILTGIAKDKVIPYIDLFSDYFQISSVETDILYVYALTILISLSSTTYASISIEGKQIEILKSLPISAQDLFRAKIQFHLSLSIPLVLGLNTLMTLFLHLPLYITLLGYVMPLSFTTFIGVTGYIINLLLPDFEWDNVTHIIKQSLPAILSALLGTFATCGTAYLLLRCFSHMLILGSFVVCAIVVLIVCIMIIWLKKNGIYIYQKL